MKSIRIVPKNKVLSLISKIADRNSACYYLNDDYEYLTTLRDRFEGKIEIRTLSGSFQETFLEIKEPFLELSARLNKRYNSFEWWGNRIAARNTASTPLVLNITYLFCAMKILLDSNKNVIFIVDSHALTNCISEVAADLGYEFVRYRDRINEYLEVARRWFFYGARILYFVWIAFHMSRAAFRFLRPVPEKKLELKKRVVLRSWVTKMNFDKSGKFRDRNFGSLAEWLRSKNYEVLTLPMFFNLSMSMKTLAKSIKKVHELMKDQEDVFLIPHHYLKYSDYARTLYDGFRNSRRRVEKAEILNIDVSGIFNEVIKNLGFDSSLLLLNLHCAMLRRLREMDFEIDGFYYPFEGNEPEKKFILCCREYFPNSNIVGFQHTTFFPNQLAYHLSPGEKDYHPLPDKIIHSGPIYVKLHKEASFPPEILVAGPNLRFESVHMGKSNDSYTFPGEKNVLLPLTYSHDLAFELLCKTNEALRNPNDYKVYVRTHPFLSKERLIRFLNRIGLDDYEFADEGIIQNWFPHVTAVVSPGGSITTLEAVTAGVPVIRLIPDNTFFYDPFVWSGYPLNPVNKASEIRDQLNLIDEIVKNDPNTFSDIGKEVKKAYFTKPCEENMKYFL